MIFRFLFVVGLFSLMSCSVTKRVHRKGIHVNWNSNYSQKWGQKNCLMSEPGRRFKRKTVSDNLNVDSLSSSSSEVSINPEASNEVNLENENLIIQKKHKAIDSEDKRESLIHDVYLDNHQFKDIIPLNEGDIGNSEHETLEIIGMVLLGLGILFLLGSFILVVGFSGFDGLYNTLVFNGNGVVVGIFGFILFLVLLLTTILFMFVIEAIGGFSIGFILGGIMIGIGFILLLVNSSRSS